MQTLRWESYPAWGVPLSLAGLRVLMPPFGRGATTYIPGPVAQWLKSWLSMFFFTYYLAMSGECCELLVWEGCKVPKSCSSEGKAARTEQAPWGCLPLHPSTVQRNHWASFLRGRQPSFSIDRKMGKLIGVIWAHFNNNEPMNMPGFDLFWCMHSWQQL